MYYHWQMINRTQPLQGFISARTITDAAHTLRRECHTRDAIYLSEVTDPCTVTTTKRTRVNAPQPTPSVKELFVDAVKLIALISTWIVYAVCVDLLRLHFMKKYLNAIINCLSE